MTPQTIDLAFPILRVTMRSARYLSLAQFDAAVEAVSAAMSLGKIRNAVLVDAKSVLSSAVDHAWTTHVSEPHFYGKMDTHPQPVRAVYDSILIRGLHDVIAARRKLAKSDATGLAVDAMRALVAEVLPLALAVASLKDHVVMGRAPSAGPAQPINPNKVIRTCAVCFRRVAVVSKKGTMAHHGYTRPGFGRQTGSCPGIGFRPLEVSSEGLEWLIAWQRDLLARAAAALTTRDSKPEWFLHRRSLGGNLERIVRSDPLWPNLFNAFVARLEREISVLTYEIPRLETRLAEWEPE